MKRKILFSVLILSFFACENNAEQDDNKSQIKRDTEVISKDKTEQQTEKVQHVKSFEDAIAFAEFCATQIKVGKAVDLEPYTEGEILLSPYAFIDTSTVRSVDIKALSQAKAKLYYWGTYVGRGDSIVLSTSDYIDKFVFNFDLEKDDVEVNTYKGNPKSRGSELHNIEKVFPNSISVEFYQSPSKKDFIDWNALIFVVTKKDNHFYLEAIVHNQWTP